MSARALEVREPEDPRRALEEGLPDGVIIAQKCSNVGRPALAHESERRAEERTGKGAGERAWVGQRGV